MHHLSSIQLGSFALFFLAAGCGPESSDVFGGGDQAGGDSGSSGGRSGSGASGTGANGSGASGSGGSGNGSSTGGGSATGTGSGTGTGTGSCSHSACDQGAALDPSCDTCTDKVCAEDAFCCNQQWDENCVTLAVSHCGDMCNAPNCVTCSQALHGEVGTLCNGVAQVLADLNACVCTDKCFAQCPGLCNFNSTPGAVCQNCISNQCSGQLNDCLNG